MFRLMKPFLLLKALVDLSVISELIFPGVPNAWTCAFLSLLSMMGWESFPGVDGLVSAGSNVTIPSIPFTCVPSKTITHVRCDISEYPGFFCAFRGKLDFAKKPKTRFFPLKLDFIAFLLSKFRGKGENLYFLALTYKILWKKLRNYFSERVKLVFKMQKLVFKTPKLLSPAFCLQGLGWISHKKSL